MFYSLNRCRNIGNIFGNRSCNQLSMLKLELISLSLGIVTVLVVSGLIKPFNPPSKTTMNQ